jgi:hypothetical protein
MSLNLRQAICRCHADEWRHAHAHILGYGVTMTRDVTFPQPGYPYPSIPKTLSRQKTLLNTTVFWFSLQLLSEKFLILTRTRWEIIINVHRSSCKVPVILVRVLMKDESAKSSNTKFHENASGGSRTVPPCGQAHGRTDGRRDRNKVVVTVRNFVNAP